MHENKMILKHSVPKGLEFGYGMRHAMNIWKAHSQSDSSQCDDAHSVVK